jgi:hypothetical protein
MANMKKLLILTLLFAALHTSAQIQFTAGINYESGVPSGAPSSTGSRLRVDLASGRIYQWSAANTTWRTLGQGIDIVAGCAAPAYTPGYAQSVFAVNGCSTPELYYYNGTEWKQVAGGGGGGATYYAGTGIDIDANDTISIDTVPRLIFYSDQTYSGGVGAMRWNSDDGTLDLGLKGGNVTLQLGQELVQPVKHATNGGLDNGKVVYITGSSGDNKTVLYARANSETTSANTLGLMTETVTGGNKGFCTTFGLVRNINTSNLTEGGAVWLSKDTAGAMTAVRPEAPNNGVFIGFCVRKHASTGVIFVNVQNGYELEELHNVYAPSPTNGQVLTYVSGNSRWEAATVADQSATNEIQTIDQFSLSGQTLSASLSSDGVSPSTVTLPVVGITAGTNVTVSESAGVYTISGSLSGVTGYVSQFNSSSTIDTTGLFWGNGSRLGVATANPTSTLAVRSSQDAPVIGTTELSSGYAGTNWTGSGLTWTHVTGSTANLTATVTNNPDGAYRVIMTITGRTAGTVTVSLKGDPITSSISATSTLYFNYVSTTGLVVTPTSDFDGTITFNVVSITPATPVISTENSSGTVNYQQRINSNGGVMTMGNNAGGVSLGASVTCIGIVAGRFNITGDNFTAIGPYAGSANKTGSSWTAIGSNSGLANRTGSSWTAIGTNAGQSSTTGGSWTAIGVGAGQGATSGSNWTSIGANAGRASTASGNWTAIGSNAAFSANDNDWVAIGSDAARNSLFGSSWVAIGVDAARFQADGTSSAQYFTNSVYIGAGTRATNGTLSVPTSNEIAIGFRAIGLGTNKTVIGNSSTAQTHLFGDLTVGSNTTASARIDVRSAGNQSTTDVVNFENSDGADILRIRSDGKNTYWATNTAAGTTSVQTINRPSGTINIAAGETSKDVNNSLCTTSSIVFAVVRTNDTTAYIKNVVPGAGSFTINLGAAATAETSVGFFIIN